MSRAVGITSNTVPWEILRAAGYAPRLLEADEGPAPYADRFMEDVFDSRIRTVFDRLCAGKWNDLEMVVIPRTSEQEHKLYLYLREASRLQLSNAIPTLYFYNLLHTRTLDSHDYGLEQTRRMAHAFQVSGSALGNAIAESNRARSCVREILRKRREGLLEGSTAMEWIRGFYTDSRASFADRMMVQLHTAHSPIEGTRPRILIKGAPLNSAAVHRVVEDAGGYVVAEDDWRGSRAAGDQDVRTDIDPVTALFEKYFYDEVSPRVQPGFARDAWFQQEIHRSRVDGVVFYIPLEDDVAGWDYPRQAAWLNTRAVPTAVVRDASDRDSVAAFIQSIPRGVSHG
jgi:benzoyl-CoA reductase/2-hydroxyglutaryl-CoA dehydratase subunit BcrC/BadD/HgdB